jgi:hypothetical protein
MSRYLRVALILVIILIATNSVAIREASADESLDPGVRLIDVKVVSDSFWGTDLVGFVQNLTQTTVRNVTISISYYEGESDSPENYKEWGTCNVIVTVDPEMQEPFTCGLDSWRDEFRVVSQIIGYE